MSESEPNDKPISEQEPVSDFNDAVGGVLEDFSNSGIPEAAGTNEEASRLVKMAARIAETNKKLMQLFSISDPAERKKALDEMKEGGAYEKMAAKDPDAVIIPEKKTLQ